GGGGGRGGPAALAERGLRGRDTERRCVGPRPGRPPAARAQGSQAGAVLVCGGGLKRWPPALQAGQCWAGAGSLPAAHRSGPGLKTNLPIFKLKESCVRRRYSDFEWLKNELERDSKIVVPPLPGKALKRQLPFRGDEGIFEESFIEERRQGLEQFINKIAGHPLAQNERCLHMFLQEETIDRNYVPGKVRQ
uniref:Sorting nexin 12 n=1 Tax=Otus sunia TaxID=257818 RepID=A0A8C8E841_9STRI